MKKIEKLHGGDTAAFDPELHNDFRDLIEKGYLEKREVAGEIIYYLTPLGDTYAEEVLGLKSDDSEIN